MKTYIFDVDGVLTTPNNPIESHFMRWFEHWMLKKEIYICTNNTYQNIMPRLGRRIIDNCQGVFACGGNSIWMGNKEITVSNWRPSFELISFLESLLKTSEFKIRTGPNIEYRTGMINFSLVGKSATEEEIDRYKQWDKISKEKKNFIEKINNNFSDLNVCFGSDTSIDICQNSNDKSKIFQYFKNKDNLSVVFHTTYGANRHTQSSIKQILDYYVSINKKMVYNLHMVNSPEETINLLKK